ncbi:MAG: helix-turn-helix domain-containing protein [Candidatus Woesearchaeota archaeon]|jgi:sugar-specific transcriptional regulator TrmB
MNEQQLLSSMGFTIYETKVYMTLLQLDVATGNEIAQHCGVPTNKVYECLIRLAEKGFIASLGIRPRKYKLLGFQRFYAALEEKKNSIKDMEKAVLSLEQFSKGKQLQDTALVLKGKDKIIDMITQGTEDSRLFIFSFVGNLHFDYQTAKASAAAIKRGVDIRFIAHKTTSHKEIYEQWKRIGVKIRFYPKEEQKSIRFTTFDGKICRITLGEPEIPKPEDYLSFWIESPAFASLLKDQFEVMWKKSLP